MGGFAGLHINPSHVVKQDFSRFRGTELGKGMMIDLSQPRANITLVHVRQATIRVRVTCHSGKAQMLVPTYVSSASQPFHLLRAHMSYWNIMRANNGGMVLK